MNISTIFSDKKISNEKIKRQTGILLKYRPVWLVNFKNCELTDKLIEWLKTLNSGFVIYKENMADIKISDNIFITWKIDETLLSWFDFIICDNDIANIKKYFENWVVPIIIRKNYLSSILKEFNPIKNEWNTFFYEELNEWSIFYATVRYLENYKFPFDNKNLVNNILKV